MCGFSGILFWNDSDKDRFVPGLQGFRRSAGRIAHRGDTDHREQLLSRLWLSHYRLAFQDVASGIQPMRSADGQHLIVFNGEVYNHLGLRDAITRESGIVFKTRSDTETILEGWKTFGDRFFERLDGEYAFIILAADGSSLLAHRDRFGVKPLFFVLDGFDTGPFSIYRPHYRFDCRRLEFASEIKGLTSAKSWSRDGLLRQFTGLFEPIRTPFDGIIQLPPGGLLRARRDGDAFSCRLSTFAEAVRNRTRSAIDQPEERFAELFGASVSDRLLSDVELGVYLSGGVDSKVVAHELSRRVGREQPMKSFTVGFTQSGYDETDEALRFARHAGFTPHVMRVDSAALNYSYPLAVQNSELVQPFTNGAAKWWLSLFARRYVSGVLTGDGADEVLCGYPSYRYANWWKFVVRGRGEARSIRDIQRLLDRRPLGSSPRDRLYVSRFASHTKNPWLSGSSAAGTGQDFVDSLRVLGVPHPLFGQVDAIAKAILGPAAGAAWLQAQAASVQSWFYAGLENLSAEREDPQNSLLLWQNYFARTHLPTLILNWVGDRMEMANTLEGRTPFLSNRLRGFIAGLPDKLMVSGLRDKVLMRRAYAKRLGADFSATPKKQFNAPFLDSDRLIADFDAEPVFATTGINPALSLSELGQAAESTTAGDTYLSTHLRAAYQTAIAASIVHKTIVEDVSLERDEVLERAYLDRGGIAA